MQNWNQNEKQMNHKQIRHTMVQTWEQSSFIYIYIYIVISNEDYNKMTMCLNVGFMNLQNYKIDN